MDHYLYFQCSLKELERKLTAFQERFEASLEEQYSEQELDSFTDYLDLMGAVFAQPLISELTFEDLEPDPARKAEQEIFFSQCKSSLSLENLPYFETNPIQVTYLLELLQDLGAALVDRGGIQHLISKEEYVEYLKTFKDLRSLLKFAPEKPVVAASVSAPVHPIDFMLRDVYRELKILNDASKTDSLHSELPSLPEKMVKVLQAVMSVETDAESLLRISKLNAKDFGDQLERVKFFLRRLNS